MRSILKKIVVRKKYKENIEAASIPQTFEWQPTFLSTRLRGHVNKKKFQKSKKTLEVGGWVKCPIGNKKKIGKHIFIHSFITFFGEHSNVYNVIN